VCHGQQTQDMGDISARKDVLTKTQLLFLYDDRQKLQI
jgi:hypothetical protein